MSSHIICRCAHSGVVNTEAATQLARGLEKAGHSVTLIDDFCEVAALEPSRMKELISTHDTLLACHERTLKSLMARAGLKQPETMVLKNGRGLKFNELKALFDVDIDKDGTISIDQTSPQWPPWFPIIDPDRCSRCRQCASFCLFGVYSIAADGAVEVSNPQGCKNLCPACARICPDAAIIFPKLDEEPYNGAEISDESALKEKIQANQDQILGDDIYEALAQRRLKAKRRLLKADALKQAEAERTKCVNASKKDNE